MAPNTLSPADADLFFTAFKEVLSGGPTPAQLHATPLHDNASGKRIFAVLRDHHKTAVSNSPPRSAAKRCMLMPRVVREPSMATATL